MTGEGHDGHLGTNSRSTGTTIFKYLQPECHQPVGSLTIVGTGIQAISQITLEAVGYIREADRVFYHATNGVTSSYIRSLNPQSIDLYEYYGEGKNRSITYVQMAELMLREVRRGLNVVGVFHGHPGYFVSPAEGSPDRLAGGLCHRPSAGCVRAGLYVRGPQNRPRRRWQPCSNGELPLRRAEPCSC